MLLGIETKTSDVVLRIAGAYRLQYANGNHVLGFCQRLPQSHRPFVFAVVIFRLPDLPAIATWIEHYGRVVHDSCRRKTLLERSRIDEWLETRTRLPQSLRDVVEFVCRKVKPTDQSPDCAICWIQRNQRRLNLR